MSKKVLLICFVVLAILFSVRVFPRSVQAASTSSAVGIIGAASGSTTLNCDPNDANEIINGGCIGIGDSAFSSFTFTALGLPLPSLSSFDTLVLNFASPGLDCTSSSLSSTDKTALVSFMTGGGKLIVVDSECASIDYTWLPATLQFTTFNPGAGGYINNGVDVEDNTLSSTNPLNPHYIDVGPTSPGGTSAGLCLNTDACGDGNVMTAKGTDLCIDITVSAGADAPTVAPLPEGQILANAFVLQPQQLVPVTGPTHVYSRDVGGAGNGMLIYDGFDHDDYFPNSLAPTSGGSGALAKLFLLELQQAWHPSGLACGTPAVVVPEYPLGLPLLAIFMIIAYGVIRRRTATKKFA